METWTEARVSELMHSPEFIAKVKRLTEKMTVPRSEMITYLVPGQVAELLEVSENTVYRRAKQDPSGELPASHRARLPAPVGARQEQGRGRGRGWNASEERLLRDTTGQSLLLVLLW